MGYNEKLDNLFDQWESEVQNKGLIDIYHPSAIIGYEEVSWDDGV